MLPEVTPSGRPEKVGVIVATPAVPVGVVTQQWMCEAVVPVVRPLNVSWTRSVCPVVSTVTAATPMPARTIGRVLVRARQRGRVDDRHPERGGGCEQRGGESNQDFHYHLLGRRQLLEPV
jgi:hypothetical protein